jgi:hypothetical protein
MAAGQPRPRAAQMHFLLALLWALLGPIGICAASRPKKTRARTHTATAREAETAHHATLHAYTNEANEAEARKRKRTGTRTSRHWPLVYGVRGHGALACLCLLPASVDGGAMAGRMGPSGAHRPGAV